MFQHFAPQIGCAFACAPRHLSVSRWRRRRVLDDHPTLSKQALPAEALIDFLAALAAAPVYKANEIEPARPLGRRAHPNPRSELAHRFPLQGRSGDEPISGS
jgi:hypothetical protein